MAITVIHGTGGAAAFTGFNVKFNTWSATYGPKESDTTGFIDNGWMTQELTNGQMAGSVGGFVQFDAASTKPTVAAPTTGNWDAWKVASCVLTATTGCTYTFTATITNVRFTRTPGDAMAVTFDFKSHGAVTEAWDETP